MERMGERLRELLERPGITMVPGAVDVLSSRVFKDVGYEAVWAGGFMSSGSQLGWADANLITVTEHAAYVKNIFLTTRLPVLVDVDNGYGNAINVIRTVREMEQAGAAGIVIEDQVLPKRCALFPGTRPIVEQSEMIGKLRAAQQARTDSSFVIVARTDSFGAGLSVDEAIGRARAYADAGADAILPISRDFSQLEQFAIGASLPIPRIIAPTLFPDVSAEKLDSLGYKLEIQPLMAAQAMYKALYDAMTVLRDQRLPQPFVDRMLTFKEMMKLVDLDQIAEWEDAFVPQGSSLATAV